MKIDLVKLPGALTRGTPSDRIRSAWNALHDVPGGKKTFSWIVGKTAPYSGSIGAVIEELRPGYARAVMRDRKRVRNHLRCLHAIALANLAEFTGNIALAYSMSPDSRFIVTRINTEYRHKARGAITAVCDCKMPGDSTEREVAIPVDLFDGDDQLVCHAELFSLVGPIARKSRRS